MIIPELKLEDPPNVGKPIRATFGVKALMDFRTVDIEFYVPEGVEWLEGNKFAHVEMKKGDREEFTVTVRILPEHWDVLRGGYYQGRFLWAQATATTAEGKRWRVMSTASGNGQTERAQVTTGLDDIRPANGSGEPTAGNHYYNYWGPGDGYHYDDNGLAEIAQIEKVRTKLRLPNELPYRRAALHLWAWEAKTWSPEGTRSDEALGIIEDLAARVAAEKRITELEAVVALTREGLYEKLMTAKEGSQHRPFWSPPDDRGGSGGSYLGKPCDPQGEDTKGVTDSDPAE